MEDNKIVLCRLCLNVIQLEDSEALDEVAKEILHTLNPKFNLDITNDPKICRSCNKTMLISYKFKNECQEKVLHSEIKIDDEVIKNITSEEKSKLCHFCQEAVDTGDLIGFNDPKGNFLEALNKQLRLNLNNVTSAAACKKCFDAMQTHFTFINTCLDTEEKIKNFCVSHGTNSQGKINLYEALEFMLNRDVKSELPENLGNVLIKEENEFETDLPLLKTEEVDIKSEEVYLVEKGTSVELNRDATSSSQSVTNRVQKKRLNTTAIQATIAKQPKLVKKEAETRSIGVQVNVRDLIEHFNVAIQVSPLDLGITTGVDATAKVANKKKASKDKHIFATTMRGANISKEKCKTKKRTYKVKK